MVDQFKKQVMFLHPEPELMEPCAQMLGDKFSVHMAQSGTEALTTLGITPIDIIVCAQDLPGMTGQEALREAKKRSPSTRGILIANDSMTVDDKAAMVTVKHLNQILNSRVTVAEICAAIHQELIAADLPTPANDFSAGPREGTSSTGSFRTDSMRLDSNATGSFEMAASEIPVLEPGEVAAQRERAISEVELVVLTNDSSFLKTIRAATGASHVVNHAPNLQEAIDIVQEGSSGVLITDAAVAVKDVETITSKLRKHMPSLVTIVAGRREDGEKMMGLISDGLVYRFLLKPISPGRSRLAIEASAKKHLTLLSTDVPLSASEVQNKMTETGIIKGVTFDSGLFRTTDVRESNINMPSLDDDDSPGMFTALSDTLRRVPPLLLAGIAIALTLVGVFLFRGDDNAVSTPQPTISVKQSVDDQEPAIAASPLPEVDRVELALSKARQALSENRLTDPADDNAIVHFAQAAALRRDDNTIRAQLDDVLGAVFTQVESNLLADDVDAASQSLEVLNATVPGHPRLAFFNRQVGKEQARRSLADVEQMIASGDLSRARTTVASLRESGAVEPSILNALENRLAASNVVSRNPTPENDLSVLLESGARRLNEGRLINPSNDSARFYFEAALAVDPGNQIALDGMNDVVSALLGSTRSNITTNNLDAAERTLEDAVMSGANAIEVEALRRQIDAQRSRQANARQQASTPPRPAEVQTNNEPTPAAEQQTNALSNAPPPPPTSVLTATEEPARMAATQPKTQATIADTNDSKPEKVPFDVADYDLVMINSSPPDYPRTAQRRGIEGWVDVQFSVGVDGKTKDVSIFDSNPGSVFDRAAIEAVENWQYQPFPTDDVSIVKKARVRLEFNLTE